MRKVRSGFRFYSPELGRWPSRDPIAEFAARRIAEAVLFLSDDEIELEEAVGAGLYRFVANNPIVVIDMLGGCGQSAIPSGTVTVAPDGVRTVRLGDYEIAILDGHGTSTPHKFIYTGTGKPAAAGTRSCFCPMANELIQANPNITLLGGALLSDDYNTGTLMGDPEYVQSIGLMQQSAEALAKSWLTSGKTCKVPIHNIWVPLPDDLPGLSPSSTTIILTPEDLP